MYSEKGCALKGKNLLSRRVNSSLFRLDPFLEGGQNRVTSHESVFIPLSGDNDFFFLTPGN